MDDESPPRRHPHHHLSSLVVRPTDSGGGGGGGGGSDYEPGEVRRDPPPYSSPYSRSDRYTNDSSGHNMRADGSVSPLHHRKVDDRYRSDFDSSIDPHVMHERSISPYQHRKVDDRYRPDFDHSISPHVMRESSVSPLRHRKLDDRYMSDFDNSSRQNAMPAASVSPLRHRKIDNHHRSDFGYSSGLRGRGFGGGRGSGRFRDFSPPYVRGRGGGRPFGRDFTIQRFDRRPFRNDGMLRNGPNVAPREGDWMCPDPLCNNLNFARRDHCNKCHKPRFGPVRSPRRNYLDPPHFSGPPLDRSPIRRAIDSYRSPPRGDWGRDGPRDFRAGPFMKPGGRFPDQHMRRERHDLPEQHMRRERHDLPEQHMRRERQDLAEDDHRGRERFDRPALVDLERRDSGRESFNGRRGYDARNGRRPISPSPPPPPPPPLPVASRDRWSRDVRERSRSPMMGGTVDYRRGSFMERGRGRRRSIARDRFDDHPY